MATLSSAGIGSNLPIDDLVSKLMTVEARPLQQLAVKEAEAQSKISALGQVKGALSALQTAVKTLQDSSKFNAVKATTTATDYLSISASNGAASGSYAIKVLELAQSQKLASGTFASTSTAVGGGSLTFSFGTTTGSGPTAAFSLNPDKVPKTVTIPAGATLAGIRDAVNKANIGVNATIVNDGTGNRLVFSSASTGTKSTLKIEAGPGSDVGLSAFTHVPGGTTLTELQPAKDAKINLDGMDIIKQSNTISDAVEGLTFTLKKKHADADAAGRVDVARNSSDVKKTIDDFVKSYNELSKTLDSLSKVDTSTTPAKGETRTAPPLAGDSVISSIRSQLRSVFIASQDVNGAYKLPNDIGLTFSKTGELTLDSSKLQKAIDNNPDDVMKLFGSAGKPSDANISFVAATGSSKTGVYDVNLTAVLNGTKLGDAVVPSTVELNNPASFVLKINGTTTGSLTLPATIYSPTSLASALQTAINADSALVAAGASTVVSVDPSGKLLISSSKTGSTSTVEVVSGDLGNVDTTNGFLSLFTTGAGTAGADSVSGTIGGYAALADGNKLTGAVGTPVAGLSIAVNGGTVGARGTIDFTKGFAFALDGVLSNLLADKNGAVAAKTDGLNAEVKRIGERRDRLNTQLEMTEARYRKQFTAMDALVSQFTSTSNYLTQQLSALSK